MAPTPNFQIRDPFCQLEPEIVIDLSDLPFASEADVSILIRTLQRVEKCGIKITLTGLQENLRRCFEIRRFDRIFPIRVKSKSHQSNFGAELRS